jgi:hypothetical protein
MLHASNLDVGVVGVVRLEEARLLELLTEGCMLRGREGLRSFCNPPLCVKSKMKSAWCGLCERSRRGTRCHAFGEDVKSESRPRRAKGARDAIYEF